jgi:shikimate dehydrogenase
MNNDMERLVALLGDPVGHSLSPAMHNAAFRHLGIGMHYMAFKVPVGAFDEAVCGLFALGASGANVTVPHKEAAFRISDTLSPSAEKAGAVNTLIFSQGGIEGHNTDIYGVRKAVSRICNRRNSALVLGAGGAARSVVCALAEENFPLIYIMNRTREKAEALKEDLATACNNAEIADLSWGDFPEDFIDLFVNTTSLGLDSNPWPQDLVLHFLESLETLSVLDMVYSRKGQTSLVEEALRRNLHAINGEEVLIQQGMAAFELFTGKAAPEEIMREVLKREKEIQS